MNQQKVVIVLPYIGRGNMEISLRAEHMELWIAFKGGHSRMLGFSLSLRHTNAKTHAQ